MADFIIIVILIVCVGGACRFLYRSRKKGAACIGCPHCSSCSGSCDTKKK